MLHQYVPTVAREPACARHIARATVLAALLVLVGGCTGSGDPPVATVGMRLDRATVPLGGPLEMTLRFTVSPDLTPMTDDYRVFVHVVDDNGEQLWADDHDPPTPTSTWRPEQVVEYARRIMVPLYPYIGEASITVGLYSTETDERVPLAGDHVGQFEYRVASVAFTPQHESSFLVYEDGWYAAEFETNGQTNWRWTSGQGVVSFQNPRSNARLMLEVEGRPALFETPQRLTLAIGERVLEEVPIESSERLTIDRMLSTADLGDEDIVRLRIAVDQTFVPADRNSGNDNRELGIRVFMTYIEPTPDGA